MKHKPALIVWGACAFAALAAVGFRAARPCFDPVSFCFLGYRDNQGIREAVVALTNNTSRALRCNGTLSVRGAYGETIKGFGLTLAGKSTDGISIPTPPGIDSQRVSCVLAAAVGQPPAWVRRIGGLLDQVGIHVYHPYPSSAAPLRVRVGSRPPGGSLSSDLNYQSVTNYWTAR